MFFHFCVSLRGSKNLKNRVFPFLYVPAGLKESEKLCFPNYSTTFLAQKMSSVKYLSLVNLIGKKDIVKELLQNNMNANNIMEEVAYLLSEDGKKKVKKDYEILINLLESKSNPYLEAAKHIL